MDRKPLPDTIPWNLRDGIEMYIDEHRPAGHFLTAVFENNLTQAINRGDAQSLAALRPLVVYLFNEAPGDCWGNERAVRDWVTRERATCWHCLRPPAPEGSHAAAWMPVQMPEIDFEGEQ